MNSKFNYKTKSEIKIFIKLQPHMQFKALCNLDSRVWMYSNISNENWTPERLMFWGTAPHLFLCIGHGSQPL